MSVIYPGRRRFWQGGFFAGEKGTGKFLFQAIAHAFLTPDLTSFVWMLVIYPGRRGFWQGGFLAGEKGAGKFLFQAIAYAFLTPDLAFRRRQIPISSHCLRLSHT